MSGRFPYGIKLKYTHMMGDDIPIWERFILRNPKYFNTVDYDFRVGSGMALQPGWDTNFKRMAKMITQKRIDVLGWRGDNPTIVEVKKRAGLSTLGQVLGYRTLFIRDFPHLGKPDLLVVTESADSDILLVFIPYRIPIVVV